ncbi:MAG TPA: ABC transporter substrate-binding protein [Xanthobacteraceae bacterium]|jgi:ABC-type nitrate/sulfonate/bicarbonate transport system substrate-binding protein
MTSRQIGWFAAAISFVVIVLGLPARSPAVAEEVIGVNAFPNAKALPLHAGIAKGIFARRGLRLNLELTQGANAQRQNFAAGKFQVVHSAIDNAVYNIEVAKLDTVILSGGDQGMNEFFVQGDIKSFADLRGRVLVVDAVNTAYALQLKKILAQHGLKEGDYTIKPVGAGVFRLKAMLEDKSNAGAILNLPFTVQAEQAGMRSLGRTTDMLGPYQGAGAYAMRSWAENNRGLLERYLAAYIESLRFVRDPANKAESIALLMTKLSLPMNVAERTYELLLDPDFGFTPDAKFLPEGYRNLMALRAEIENKQAKPNSGAGYVDLSYYENALKLVGP